MAQVAQLTRDPSDVADRSVVTISRSPSTIAAEATLDDALQALLAAGSNYLVVVGPGGRLVGVLGGRQLVATWAGSPEAFAVTPVTALLDSVPPIVAPTATAATVARVMRDHASDVVVVIGQDRVPLGLVVVGDLVAAIADSG
jgi:CBS domain-containing protein